MTKAWPRGTAFDQPVVLRQPGIWSHVIVWSLVGSATGLVVWAAFAPLEQAVPVSYTHLTLPTTPYV